MGCFIGSEWGLMAVWLDVWFRGWCKFKKHLLRISLKVTVKVNLKNNGFNNLNVKSDKNEFEKQRPK